MYVSMYLFMYVCSMMHLRMYECMDVCIYLEEFWNGVHLEEEKEDLEIRGCRTCFFLCFSFLFLGPHKSNLGVHVTGTGK